MHSKVHVPDFKKPGHISVDGWENKTAHVHGGQKLVLGLHDNYAALNRSYLCAKKSDHADAIDKGLIWFKGRLNVTPVSVHADNAPDLIAGSAAAVVSKHKVAVTSCPPYDPKGNGKREGQSVANAGE